ncbi:MAG TPA: DUF1552 domain-containing protein [Polyangia bacterium]|nr:DUF1552 domain-containing protein [Polyangia bacterium]
MKTTPTTTKRTTTLSRRRFIKTLGAVPAVALPVLRSSPLLAATPITRLLVFFTPNGTVYESWGVTGLGTNYSIAPGSIMEPLAKFKAKLNILQGVSYLSEAKGPGNHHARGAGHCLTGRQLLTGNIVAPDGSTSGYASGISVDQYMTGPGKLPATTKFRTLEVGVAVKDNGVKERLAYAGSNQPLPPENNPWTLFQRVFGDGVTPAGAMPDPAKEKLAMQRLAERRSILDFAAADLTSLSRRLPGDERTRLERHLTSIRDIEQQLVPSPGATAAGGACAPPTIGSMPGAMIDPLAAANFPAVGKLQMDIAVAALACNMTRVITMLWSAAASQQTFPWLGINTGHHTMSHEGDADKANTASLVKVSSWYAQQFVYLLDRMDSINDGDGTLLDHSIVPWTNELSKGNTHSPNNIPWVLAGGAAKYFPTGRLIQYPKEQPHNNLLVSFMNALGLPDEKTFGDPDFCTGPLQGLTG